MNRQRRPRRPLFVVVGVALGLIAASCGGGSGGSSAEAPSAAGPGCPAMVPERLVPQVQRKLPHDPGAFTQGLVIRAGVLYESTGLEGRSSLRAIDPATGQIRTNVALGPGTFAEGLAIAAAGTLVQLTWKEGRANIWDPVTMSRVGRFSYAGEGWGLSTLDDGTLVMSDGSDRLVERDPKDFSVTRRWTVARPDGRADRLNELEWDGRRLWANRWQTNEILRIDPVCRRVDGVVDATALDAAARSSATSTNGPAIDVLNGIANLPGTDQFLVTGKLWPTMFQVRFVPA